MLCNSARAEWTGDSTNHFYSNAVITDMHVGQLDNSQYFCIKAQLTNNNTISACSVQKQGKWGGGLTKFCFHRQNCFIQQGNV
ncbi:TPA: subtilase family AB5 toxin binding subunit [Escherichia coli]